MMLPYQCEKAQCQRWLVGGLLILLVTLALLTLPLGDGLAKLSFDLPFLFRRNLTDTNVVVLVEDRATLDALGQTNFPPARTVHAQLLDKLREEGARLVVFDISFRASKPGEDEAFAVAIHRHGQVILGGVVETTAQQLGDSYGTSVAEVKPPAEALRAAAADWGLLVVGDLDSTFRIRKIVTQWKNNPTVPWLAAKYSGAFGKNEDAKQGRWINFYGASPALDQVTQGEVLGVGGRKMPPGYLRGKVVFVGFDASVTPATGRRDLFATPFTRWGQDFTPGVEILANIYANLANHDWLRQMSVLMQCSLAVLFGAVSFVMFYFAGRRWMWLAAPFLFLLLVAFSLILQCNLHCWWNWLVLALVQLPMTVLLAWIYPRLPVVAFISYRREGGEAFAMALLHELRLRGLDALLDKHFGSGEFPKQIFHYIDRVPNVLVVLSPGALDERIANPDDWMRIEISHSFTRNKNIIPIFLDGVDFKQCAPLPSGMEKLDQQQSVFHHADNWDATFAKIKTYLKH